MCSYMWFEKWARVVIIMRIEGCFLYLSLMKNECLEKTSRGKILEMPI